MSLFGKQWNLNAPASIFSGSFKPATETRKYDQLENGYTLTVEGTENGKNYKWSYTAFYDGKPHPVTGRSDVDAITIAKISDTQTAGIFDLKGENVAFYARKTVPQSLVVTVGGKAANGSTYFDKIEYS